MSWNVSQLPEQHGKTFVITGANSGIGFEAARGLARLGASVVLACRDLRKAQAAVQRIQHERPAAQLLAMPLDLGDLASVREFAAGFRAQHASLHGLINNAGVMAIPRTRTKDGFEAQLGVNHLGHFALTGLLLDRLLATPEARVVSVSSQASGMGQMYWDDLDAERHYDKWRRYGQSKLANLLFSFELARRCAQKQLTLRSVACHPGYAATNLQLVGPNMTGSSFGALMMKLGNALLAQSAEAGAWPTLYAACMPDANNGDYIGPMSLGHWRGRPGHGQARRLAHNPEQMRKLWEVSVARTGVDFAALA